MELIFTEAEIEFMRSVIGVKCDFSNLTGDDFAMLEEVVGDYLIMHGFDKDYEPNHIGIICEELIDKITSVD